MKDLYFGDRRDVVKWSVLLHLADRFSAVKILQIAYYTETRWDRVSVGEDEMDVRPEVLAHFRDIHRAEQISERISVLDIPFTTDRNAYHESALRFIAAQSENRCIVFLDPDTGLQPRKCGLSHISDDEVAGIWDRLKQGDVLVLYQHKTNKSKAPWIEPKRQQFADDIGVSIDRVCTAESRIADDVVFFFVEKR